MIRRPPRSTLSSSSAASDVYKRQGANMERRTVFQLLGLSALALGGASACSSTSSTTGGTTSAAAGTTAAAKAALRIPLSDIPVGGGVIRASDKVVVTQA